MFRFIIKRLLAGVLVIWGIVTLLFLIFNVLGNPAESMTDENTDEATRLAIEKAYHLDQSTFFQYLWYLNDLSPVGILDRGDPELKAKSYTSLLRVGGDWFIAVKEPWMRRSFQSNRKVSAMLADKLPGTALLAFASIFVAVILGIPLGIVSALKKGLWGDRLITFITLLGISAPSFFVAVVLIRIFSVGLGDITGLPITGYLFEKKIFDDGYTIYWANLILPTIALGIRPLSIITQLTRSSMIEVLTTDYIRTARAKGLSDKVVLYKHGLRNALNPVVTSVSGWFASLIAGAFFIETIFDWQGLGKLTIDALSSKDYPVILGAAILIGVVFVSINILVDLLYTRLDPRIGLS